MTVVNFLDCPHSLLSIVLRRDGVPYEEALIANHSGFGSQGCGKGIPTAQAEARSCFEYWHQCHAHGSAPCFVDWLKLRLQSMKDYMGAQGENQRTLGSCTTCWFITADAMLNILFNASKITPEESSSTVNSVMLELLKPRRLSDDCSDAFLPRCAHKLNSPPPRQLHQSIVAILCALLEGQKLYSIN